MVNVNKAPALLQKPKTKQKDSSSESMTHTVSHMIGEIVWLMTRSSFHKHFSLADLDWMIIPPILLNQYKVFHDQGSPVGAAFWAFTSDEASKKLSMEPPRLRPNEWNSSSQCWLVLAGRYYCPRGNTGKSAHSKNYYRSQRVRTKIANCETSSI
jgi:hemolysin-activating ACP:hemolysin acyltransferase